jgi:hypothetical protein
MKVALLTTGLLLSTVVFAESKVTGSIPIKGRQQTEYPALAKITSAQAIQTAKDSHPGQVISVALEKEDGFLVYSVKVLDAENIRHEIVVDAGNGKILTQAQETGNSKHKDHKHHDGDDDDDN